MDINITVLKDNCWKMFLVYLYIVYFVTRTHLLFAMCVNYELVCQEIIEAHHTADHWVANTQVTLTQP